MAALLASTCSYEPPRNGAAVYQRLCKIRRENPMKRLGGKNGWGPGTALPKSIVKFDAVERAQLMRQYDEHVRQATSTWIRETLGPVCRRYKRPLDAVSEVEVERYLLNRRNTVAASATFNIIKL